MFRKVISRHLRSERLPSTSIEHFPFFTRGNNWETIGTADWDDWVAGFWPGILWMGTASDDVFRERARSVTNQVRPGRTGNFNVGFRYQYSWMSGYEVTGNTTYRKQTERAVDRLLECFHPGIGLIGHGTPSSVLVSATDVMMNLPLLMWSYHRGYKPVRSRLVAETTLTTAMDQFIRPDHSVYHVLKFDRQSGDPPETCYPQGIDDGCWSRGLAWMTAGLVLGGLSFRRDDCLSEARNLIAYHREQSPGSIPPFDYRAGQNSQFDVHPDTSAAAILCSAMFLLSLRNGWNELRHESVTVMNTLISEYFRGDQRVGLVDGSSYHVPENTGVNEASIWGDFFTLEALHLRDRSHLPPHLNWLNVA